MIRSDSIKVTCGGREVTDLILSLQVVQSFADLSNECRFDVYNENKPLVDRKPLPYRKFDKVEVFFSNTLMFRGEVSGFQGSENEKDWKLNVICKSSTNRLVRGDILKKGSYWVNKTLVQIVREVCQPYGIEVKLDPLVADDPLVNREFSKTILEAGEKGIDLIRRLCRARGLMAYTKPEGTLILGRAQTVFHEEVLTAENIYGDFAFEEDLEERHSRYIVKSQHFGTDTYFGEAAAHGYAVVEDPQVEAYCPVIIMADGNMDKNDLIRRAEWERNARAALSNRVMVTVYGWRDSKGIFWSPNTRVHTISELFEIDDILLIMRSRFIAREDGLVTGLELCHPAAFEPEVLPKAKKSKTKGSRMAWD